MKTWTIAASALALAWSGAASAGEPADIAAAVADTDNRREDNVALDANRHPVEMLAFGGLKQGMRVLDLFGANLYWSELMAPALGPDGLIVIWNPNQFLSPEAKAGFEAFHARQPRTVLIHSPMENPILGSGYDLVLMNLDYHDVYWESEKYKISRMEPATWTGAIAKAMAPGGVLLLADHRAKSGAAPRESVEAYHRIDPAVVVRDFTAAGLVLEEESELLANPADGRETNVFAPDIRGKTDRFLLRFRKPE
ncbi:methyltransferase [Sphingomicrobium nitratireducens]|uniref:methyltransferase n=1 Tax=Sphingomicrobium nitratireducens TaxID=2964666 RepID=UPI00223F6191|nr:methyltransferase [Sphingomicrobium nitratireducens]